MESCWNNIYETFETKKQNRFCIAAHTKELKVSGNFIVKGTGLRDIIFDKNCVGIWDQTRKRYPGLYSENFNNCRCIVNGRCWLYKCCGSGFDSSCADPDSDFQLIWIRMWFWVWLFNPDADPDLDPSFQIKAQTLENVCSDSIIFHTFLLSSANWCGSAAGSRFLFDADADPGYQKMRIWIHNTGLYLWL